MEVNTPAHTIPFTKMSGSGNDFIVIDNRSGRYTRAAAPEFVRAVCRRRHSIGADGVIIIVPSSSCDFAWKFFNADGSVAEMCGNGARCVARYAAVHGIAGTAMAFETLAGVIRAEVVGARVRIRLSPPREMQLDLKVPVDGEKVLLHSINTGVPHVVCFVDDIEGAPVRDLGARIRYHHRFQPAGTNVNFVAQSGGGMLQIRTYERGVEDETYACGTGTVAAALIAIARGLACSPVALQTRGGDILTVYAAGGAQSPFDEVVLEGGARLVCEGTLTDEALA
jgi:diaminopimelate epimerase